MTNPFNRADKHGAPDMRVTPPPSAETPMPPPANVQFMTAREQVEHGHRTRGEPTYAELQAINAELLAALESVGMEDDIDIAAGFVLVSIPTMEIIHAAILKTKGIAE